MGAGAAPYRLPPAQPPYAQIDEENHIYYVKLLPIITGLSAQSTTHFPD